jgi:hypothetical protein
MRPRNKTEFSISEIMMYPNYVILILFCFSVLYLSLKCNPFNNWHFQISRIGGMFYICNVHYTLTRIRKEQMDFLLTLNLYLF